mmetsp:Transcript_22650/g.51797  ORF Transcript_22650/g.51797 Transcript_22650/m.51797 type:complete len:372 (-) Transcript_22650:74-1189(-)
MAARLRGLCFCQTRLHQQSSAFAGSIRTSIQAAVTKKDSERTGTDLPDRQTKSSLIKKLSLSEALYLAKEANIVTLEEVQRQIVTSPPFSSREKPFLLENFFELRHTEEEFEVDEKVDWLTMDHDSFAQLEPGEVLQWVHEVLVKNENELDGFDPKQLVKTLQEAPTEDLVGSTFVHLTEEELQDVNGPYKLPELAARILGSHLTFQVRAEEAEIPAEVHGTILKHFRPELPSTFRHAGREWLARAEGRGTRKRAVAHAVLLRGSGIIKVNGEESLYSRWPWLYHRFDVCQPFRYTGTAGAFDVFLEVRGGGPSGQAGAARLAVSRALFLACPACHDDLQKGFCLLEDTRQKLSKQPGRPRARKKYKWSKR